MTVATRTSKRAKYRKAPPQRAARVNMAEKSAARPPTEERGTSGTIAWGGMLSSLATDYAAAWQMPRRWTTAENMRADPAVTAALAALTFPILGAAFTVEPASDDPEDVRMAEFVEEGMNNMTTDLSTHRVESLDSVGDGVSVFYTRYEQREDGLWWLRKLKLLPNKAITTWHVDEYGGPDGVSQLIPQTGKEERFKMDELLVFSHMRRGDSILGRPALRAMYRPWFLIDKLSRVGAIAVERGASGTPWARYVGGSSSEADRLDRALQGLHANERTFLRIDQDVTDWGIKGIEGSTVDPVPLMEYQRRDLFLAPLAQFLALGTDGVGSMALSGDHSSFFVQALDFIKSEIEAVYNKYLIPRWIGYNWTVSADQLPHVKLGPVDRRNVGTWTAAVAAMVQAGVPLPMEVLAEEATRMLGITVPERQAAGVDGEDVADVNDPNAPEPNQGGQPGDLSQRGAWAGVDLAAGLKSPIMLETLGIAVDFAGMTTALDEAEAEIIRALTPLQEAQRRRLLNAAKAIIKRGDAEALAAFSIQFDKEEAAILAALVGLYERGGAEAVREIEQQDAKPGKVERAAKAAALAYLGIVAAEAARSLADRMRTAWGSAVVSQIQTGYNAAALDAAVSAPGARLLADVARRGSSTALGMGRTDVAAANAAAIEYEVWSAMMDDSTCESCRALDGEPFAVGEGPTVPNVECAGGYRCRCLRIAVVGGRNNLSSMPPFPGYAVALHGSHDQKTHGRGGGADLFGDMENIVSRVGNGRSVTDLQNMPENPLLYEVTRLQGMHGTADVMSPDEFDGLPGDHTRVFRGVHGDEFADPVRFASDPVWYGRGVSGDGIYTSTKASEAQSYAGGEARNVMSIAIKPNARVANYDDLRKEYNADIGSRSEAEDRIRKGYTGKFNEVSTGVASGRVDRETGGAELRRLARMQEDEIRNYRHPLDGLDMGAYAAAKGYDIIRNDQFKDRFVGEHYVVLNRAAVIVRGR